MLVGESFRDKYMTKNIINIIISAALMLALSHCDNRQQAKQTEEDIAGKKESERVSTVVTTKSLRNSRESKYRLTTEDIIANELKAAKDEYENKFRRDSMPNCEQCSDLELLLILERAIDAYYHDGSKASRYIFDIKGPHPNGNIKSVSYLKEKEMTKTKEKLRQVEAKYEQKFNTEVPWWWMCPVKERIRRLEEAINIGKRHTECRGAGDKLHYKMAKAMAAYELWFNKPVPREMTTTYIKPEIDYPYLEKALKANLPLLSYEEDTRLKQNLKSEYQKRFGKQIPDTVLLIARVYIDNRNDVKIAITRTVTGGAIAKDLTNGLSAPLELELSTGEWLDFINALYKLILEHNEKWRKWIEKNGRRGTVGYRWSEPIFDFDLLNTWDITDFQVDPTYLYEDDFNKVINNMAERIKKDGKTSHD